MKFARLTEHDIMTLAQAFIASHCIWLQENRQLEHKRAATQVSINRERDVEIISRIIQLQAANQKQRVGELKKANLASFSPEERDDLDESSDDEYIAPEDRMAGMRSLLPKADTEIQQLSSSTAGRGVVKAMSANNTNTKGRTGTTESALPDRLAAMRIQSPLSSRNLRRAQKPSSTSKARSKSEHRIFEEKVRKKFKTAGVYTLDQVVDVQIADR